MHRAKTTKKRWSKISIAEWTRRNIRIILVTTIISFKRIERNIGGRSCKRFSHLHWSKKEKMDAVLHWSIVSCRCAYLNVHIQDWIRFSLEILNPRQFVIPPVIRMFTRLSFADIHLSSSSSSKDQVQKNLDNLIIQVRDARKDRSFLIRRCLSQGDSTSIGSDHRWRRWEMEDGIDQGNRRHRCRYTPRTM